MVTRSRTYKPTDWQLWVYTPVADVWRWDFSTWDGADVWGDVAETGSMQVLDTKITNITVTDGSVLESSVLGVVSGASMVLSGVLDSWNAGFITEMYNGKKVALTLKNEADYDTVDFGRNTIYFVGRITSCITTLDPATNQVFYTITADDYFSQALSQLINYDRSIVDPKYASLQYAYDLANVDGNFPSFLNLSLYTASDNTNQFATRIVDTLGVLLADYVASEVCVVLPTFEHNTIGGQVRWSRTVDVRPLFTPSGFRQITDAEIISIEMANDGGDRPTSFKLSNLTTTVEFGANQQGYLANQNTYTKTIDTTTAGLQYTINTLQTTTAKLSPIRIGIETAVLNHPIIYSYTGSDSYIYPDNHHAIGDELTIDSDALDSAYDVFVTGITHTIDADNWVTTLELSKGL